ncbi:hypothetical protein QQF64_009227 [Cirrhinus molitorella]|uniref:Uncharacterized protein n=1 Tax=Cirrhinus molitorella TaxID=172907 RepID=A0ABR3M0K4_9TELE
MSCIGSSLPLRAACRFSSSLNLLNDANENGFRGPPASIAVLEEDGRENKVKVPENEDDDGGFPPVRAQEFLISLIRVRRFCIYY